MARTALTLVCFLALAAPSGADEPAPAKGGPSLVELYRSGGLFDRNQYRAVRAAFTRLFEKKHADTIRAAFGEDYDVLSAWLNKRPDIKEELLLALDEEHDEIEAALRLFASLRKEFPKEVEAQPGLAIATAVVWDRPDADGLLKPGGVYDYAHHQKRTRSTMPEGALDARGNFEYVAKGGANLPGLAKGLPWEFLVFLVDHKTPLKERKWAQKYFLSRRGTVSSWYQEVPYDHGMLETERLRVGPGPKLRGREYTLENIKRYGGVCAQQADFVARVGKSLGQPTVYVGGESSYRGRHAWVMWVQVSKSAKDKVRFTLVSDGRTRGYERDAFYTGTLKDPQTGRDLLDRDMERRLSVIGLDPQARRQASLAMRAYGPVCDELKFAAKERLAYLDRVWQLCPQAEEAWLELARLGKAGELNGPLRAAAAARLATLTRTFTRYPDFIARLSDDLLTPEPKAERLKHYERMVAMFEKAGRPDLCCDVRLKIAGYWKEQKRYKEAAQALTQAVRKFPTEGRYIPVLLVEYEAICEDYAEGVKPLAALYLELGPALAKHYKGEENPFLDKVVDQAEKFYERYGLKKQASTFKKRVEQAKASSAGR